MSCVIQCSFILKLKENVIVMKLLSLVTLELAQMTTFSAASDENLVQMLSIFVNVYVQFTPWYVYQCWVVLPLAIHEHYEMEAKTTEQCSLNCYKTTMKWKQKQQNNVHLIATKRYDMLKA